MSSFKQSSSSKFQDYMIQMIRKIHDAEEMLLSGDDRHLEDLKEVASMINQYVSEAQGQKFEPMQYRQMQGQPQGTQSFYEYPEMERGRDTRGHIGYVPYYPSYPVYPFFNQGGGSSGGSQGGQGYSNERGSTDGRDYPRR